MQEYLDSKNFQACITSTVQEAQRTASQTNFNMRYTLHQSKTSCRPSVTSRMLCREDRTMNPEQSCWYCKDTGHELPNYLWLQKKKGLGGSSSSFTGIKPIKLKSPSLGGCERRGNQKMRPEAALTRLNYSTLLQTLSNSSISAESKHQIIQRAVSNCPSVNLQLLGVELPSFLDSGSMVTLIREGFFTKYILPELQESQELSQAHSLFRLLAAKQWHHASVTLF